MATASELFEARHYPGVVALMTEALEDEPECVPLLLVRARAHMALRRDLEAQGDLRDIIRLDPQCSLAYRLLGELAARRDENESAAIFFQEALRLDPDDHEADTWLAIVQATARPAAVAQKLPAPAAAAGRFPSRSAAPAASAHPRFAKGTRSPEDDRPTARFTGTRERLRTEPPPVPSRPGRPAERPVATLAPDIDTEREITALPPPPNDEVHVETRFGGGSQPHLRSYPEQVKAQAGVPELIEAEESMRSMLAQTQKPLAAQPIAQPRHAGVFRAYPAESHDHRDDEPSAFARGSEAHVPNPHAAHVEQRTKQGAQPVRRPLSQPGPSAQRSPIPESPGFGDYLVSTGILTRERLRAAQAYQRSMKVQLATAIVTLGLATPQRIEWAAVAHQSQLGRSS